MCKITFKIQNLYRREIWFKQTKIQTLDFNFIYTQTITEGHCSLDISNLLPQSHTQRLGEHGDDRVPLIILQQDHG